jgi:hypothetical protein
MFIEHENRHISNNYNSETEQVTMVGVILVSLGRTAYRED